MIAAADQLGHIEWRANPFFFLILSLYTLYSKWGLSVVVVSHLVASILHCIYWV